MLVQLQQVFLSAKQLIKRNYQESVKDYNNTLITIKGMLKDMKYNDIINNYMKEDLEKLMNKMFSEIDMFDYINKFMNNNLKDINSRFEGNINDLNFILFGETGAGKSTLINNILELTSGKDGAYVDPDNAQSTTLNFTKYNNTKKIGLRLWDSQGCEINHNFTLQTLINQMNEFFHEKITDTDEELIYGFIYVLNSNSFNEEKDLKNFYNYYFNQIPLKIVITDKSKSSFKRLNKTIAEKMKETNIKPFLLGSKDASDYKINIIEFLKEFLEELTEEKLKDIYKFYYSLNIFDIINKNIYITLDKYNFIDSMIETHKNIDQN